MKSRAEFVFDKMQDTDWFATRILGMKPTSHALAHGYTSPFTPDQQAINHSVQHHKYTLVEAHVGGGKTMDLAVLVLQFLFSHKGAKVITTAPTVTQVETLLWSEIASLYTKSKIKLGGRLLQTEIRIQPNWFAIGLSPARGAEEQTAVRFQGFHAPSIMLAFDEGVGVHPAIWEAGFGLAIGPNDKWVVIGNPTDPTSEMKRQSDSGLWNVVHISALNHPNVIHDDPLIIPGAVTKQWCEERLKRYGRPDNPLYRSKVLGLWPLAGSDTLIHKDWLDQATQDWSAPLPTDLLVTTGCDVARFGDDDTVFQDVYEDGTFDFPTSVNGQNIIQTAKELADKPTPLRVVDDIGVGGGVTDWLVDAGYDVTPFRANDKPTDPDFANLRAETYWYFAECLRQHRFALPNDPELLAQLQNIRYTFDGRGHIKIEDKADIKKRAAGASPDKADAAAIAAYGYRLSELPNAQVSVIIGPERENFVNFIRGNV